MSFFLFFLVNAVLLLRPTEIVPELLGLPIYEVVILLCLVTALPEIMAFLSGPGGAGPITWLVFGLLAAMLMSHLAAFNLAEAWRTSFYFFKIVVYYVLLVSIVNTPGRLRSFVLWLAGFTVILAVLAVLQYHDIIHLASPQMITEIDIDPTDGHEINVHRLQGGGLDPNEFCVLLAATAPLILYRLTESALLGRLLWLAPLGLAIYGVRLSQSRGGFLALVAGLGACAWVRWGTRRIVLAGIFLLPVLALGFGGRQTDLSATSGTGQTRIQIWSDWLMEFRKSPLCGKGMGLHDPTKEAKVTLEKDYVAHNSFLHCFTELGLFGGTLFLGTFYLALWMLVRISKAPANIIDPGQRRLQPFVTGTMVALLTGMMTLSLSYLPLTYVLLGLAVSFGRVTVMDPPLAPLRIDGRVAGRLAFLSAAFLAGIYVVVRVFIRWS